MIATRRLTASELKAGHGQDGAVHVPLALAGLDPGVDADRVVVALVTHQLHAPVVQADGEDRAVGLGKALDPVIPLHADDFASTYAHERESSLAPSGPVRNLPATLYANHVD